MNHVHLLKYLLGLRNPLGNFLMEKLDESHRQN